MEFQKQKQYKITRQALELISYYNFGVSIETKSNLIVRDIFKEMNGLDKTRKVMLSKNEDTATIDNLLLKLIKIYENK